MNTSKNNAEIRTFNLKKISKDTAKLSQFQLASSLLNKFLQNELKTSDVFDLSMTAKYFALTDLMQSLTANTWYDMRFYFDPISARIIPIGYDAQIPSYIERRMLSLDQNVLKYLKIQFLLKNIFMN